MKHINQVAFRLLLFFTVLFFSACGGGGGSSAPTVNDDQTIENEYVDFSAAVAEMTPVQSDFDEFMQLAEAFNR